MQILPSEPHQGTRNGDLHRYKAFSHSTATCLVTFWNTAIHAKHWILKDLLFSRIYSLSNKSWSLMRVVCLGQRGKECVQWIVWKSSIGPGPVLIQRQNSKSPSNASLFITCKTRNSAKHLTCTLIPIKFLSKKKKHPWIQNWCLLH